MFLPESFIQYLKDFHFSQLIPQDTVHEDILINDLIVPKFINEFWTSQQRKAANIHEISYRACFKPQLPRFFITQLTQKGDRVYDPFTGRGTTPIEAGLLGRKIVSNDINPLSKILTCPRFYIPSIRELSERLESISYSDQVKADIDLSMFYHPKTESELVSLQTYLLAKTSTEEVDQLDHWIRMVATNRLTGHSPGFFSVYTLPPNQAISAERQRMINEKRSQIPEYRDTKELILKKSRQLISGITEEQRINLSDAGEASLFLTHDARKTENIPDESIQLTVTSPPFLDIVQYSKDNWLRCWFNGISVEEVSKNITNLQNVQQWASVMGAVFTELFRITKPRGYVAFEVGEVKKGKIKLDEIVVPLGIDAGFDCIGIVINNQDFTKTSNIWGVTNMEGGTNTNRIVIFYKNR